MKRLITTAIAGATLIGASPAYAEALHGFCSPSCPDLGSNSPTSTNPPVFGFAYSGGSATGNLRIDILIPNNVAAPGPFTITQGLNTYSANLVKSTAWTSGQLGSYLGISASPSNPIGAFIPDPADAAATGFWVYQALLGSTTVPGTSAIDTPAEMPYLMNLTRGLAQGSYIVAFLDTDAKSLIATANSGAILETRRPLPEPATWALMLLGFAGIGMSMRRRTRTALEQIA